MNTLDRTIPVPKALHEVHGERTSPRDLFWTYLAALGVMAVVIALGIQHELPAWKTALAALIAVDLAGGVVSNFSECTNAYYNGSRRRRAVFLALHVVQPAVLAFLFPESALLAGTVMIYTLAWALVIALSAQRRRMRTTAAAAVVAGIIGIVLWPAAFPGLTLMLLLYLVKLVLAFAVDWSAP